MKSKIFSVSLVLINCFVLFTLSDLLIGSFYKVPVNELIRTKNSYYHHGFIPSVCGRQIWGEREYELCTNSLGLVDESPGQISRAGTDKRRILLIGDSFTEGIGVEFGRTFAGIIKNSVDRSKTEVLNAGVSSYSPHLYYLKVKYLEDLGLQIDSLFVFIDISDPSDEIIYEDYQPVQGPVTQSSSVLQIPYSKTEAFLKSHSLTYREVRRRLSPPDPIILFLWKDIPGFLNARGRWTYDDTEFNRWGKRGLDLCGYWMDTLYRQCVKHGITLHIVVYPWPEQIRIHDLNSRQVTFWKCFCESRGISFTDFFPQFIDNPLDTESTIEKFFLLEDVHWNEQGHRLIAEKLLNDFPGIFGYSQR